MTGVGALGLGLDRTQLVWLLEAFMYFVHFDSMIIMNFYGIQGIRMGMSLLGTFCSMTVGRQHEYIPLYTHIIIPYYTM